MYIPNTISHQRLARFLGRKPIFVVSYLEKYKSFITATRPYYIEENVPTGVTTWNYKDAIWYIDIDHLRRYAIITRANTMDMKDRLYQLKELVAEGTPYENPERMFHECTIRNWR